MTNGYRPEMIQHAFIDFIGSHLQPFWSFTVPKLRLVARYTLSDDLIALRFETNHAFRRQLVGSQLGWQGGQYLNLSVLIEGVYHQRSYSLLGLAHQPLWWHDVTTGNSINSGDSKKQPPYLAITIAIKPQGLVSDYLTKHMTLGSVINSSVPSGSFTLAQSSITVQTKSAAEKPTSLLFIASGSGITPMLGLITQALDNGHQVTLLYYSRTEMLPFKNQWQQLSIAYPAFTYHLVNTEKSDTYLAGKRHLSLDSLLALNLPLADTQIFACGSQTLLTGLYKAAAEITLPHNKNLRDNIIVENFGHALPDFNFDNKQALDRKKHAAQHTVYLRARQRQFNSSTTLLNAAEDAGIRLAHGCRQGICQLCRCNKVSGVVKNIHTGKMSSDGYESIQTCINIAMTDVVLDI